MLTQEMVNKLNEQINLEFYSSNLYLQMSAWAEGKGYDGCAAFLKEHADEEMMHMKRLFTYVNETGSTALIGAIDAPPAEFGSIKALFEAVFEHEQLVTQSINALAHTAFTNQDYSTFNFLQWYVAEQHEEEKLFKGILDKIEIIGEDGKGLFFIDKEIGKMIGGNTGGSIMDQPAEV
ncbi:MAG: non-heme ferritin [Marinobacterium sp.]|nr:non-heme ferritin [Marinobacterium sp.]